MKGLIMTITVQAPDGQRIPLSQIPSPGRGEKMQSYLINEHHGNGGVHSAVYLIVCGGIRPGHHRIRAEIWGDVLGDDEAYLHLAREWDVTDELTIGQCCDAADAWLSDVRSGLLYAAGLMEGRHDSY
jgi:hypothetical protein